MLVTTQKKLDNKKMSESNKIKPKQTFISEYLFRRSVVIFMLTFLLIIFLAKQRAHIAVSISILTCVFTYLISTLFQQRIDKVLVDRINFRSNNLSKKKITAVSSISDNFVYALDFGFAINSPFLVWYIMHKQPRIAIQINAIFYSNQFWIFLIVISVIYTGLLFFVYKKRYFWIYTLLLLTVPIAFVLDFYGDILNLSKLTKRFFFVYSMIMGAFLGVVAAVEYFDENIQKRNGRIKVAWNKLIEFIAWDFLKGKGK
jgi:hypothetical protein